MDQYAYFLMRIRRPAEQDPAESFDGVVQRLSTGEKRSFTSREELLGLMRAWPDAHGTNMEQSGRTGNER